uniref:Nucleolar protein 12 n=2 Tax=Macrostomum lignano TaxID=282301 RepID=A0A1I8GC22_9PLAT
NALQLEVMTRPPSKQKNKKPTAKRVILFDEAKRAEYLTGFHKRKVERRKLALRKAADELKEEKRLLKERHEALVLQRAGVLAPDMQMIECQPVTEELPEHTVTVTELDLQPTATIKEELQQEVERRIEDEAKQAKVSKKIQEED